MKRQCALEPIAKVIIYGYRGGQYRAIRLIWRQRARGLAISKEQWDIVQILNIGVILYRMRIIEMQRVVKMIGIGQYNDCHQQTQP